MHKIEEFYPRIGKLVVRFQQLDFGINMMINMLMWRPSKVMMCPPDVVSAFCVSLSFSKKLDVLKSISPFLFSQEFGDQLDSVIKACSLAEELRNAIIHSTLLESENGESVFQHKPQASRKCGMRKGGIRQYTVDELEKAIEKIDSALSGLYDLIQQLETKEELEVTIFKEKDKGKSPRNSSKKPQADLRFGVKRPDDE